MESRINYAQVGLFVIGLSIALVVGVYWLIASSGHQNYQDYLTIMRESVAGLTEDSPVKFNGVKVGYVRKIHLNPDNPREVRIVLAVAAETPITVDTTATLEPQGLTGLRFVELTTARADAAPLKPPANGRLPVIQSRPSLIFRLDTAIRELIQDMDKITRGVEHIVGEENRKALRDVLQNLSAVSSVFAKNSQALDATLKNTDRFMRQGVKISHELPSMLKEVKRTAQSVQRMSQQIQHASATLDQTLKGSQAAAQTLTTQTLPASTDTLQEMAATTEMLRQLLETLKRHPNVLIRGQRPALGPGE